MKFETLKAKKFNTVENVTLNKLVGSEAAAVTRRKTKKGKSSDTISDFQPGGGS